jgi:hypothetical protein
MCLLDTPVSNFRNRKKLKISVVLSFKRNIWLFIIFIQHSVWKNAPLCNFVDNPLPNFRNLKKFTIFPELSLEDETFFGTWWVRRTNGRTDIWPNFGCFCSSAYFEWKMLCQQVSKSQPLRRYPINLFPLSFSSFVPHQRFKAPAILNIH